MRKIPLLTRVIATTGGATVSWTGEGKPKPLSKMAFEGSILPPRKVSGLCVITDELVRSSDPAAEPLIRNDLVGAISEFLVISRPG